MDNVDFFAAKFDFLACLKLFGVDESYSVNRWEASHSAKKGVQSHKVICYCNLFANEPI